MSVESSISRTSPSASNPESTSQERYIFVQHSDNVNASSTRQAVRSHAMSAVRRLQRQRSAKPIQLKWPEEYSARRTIGRAQRTWPDGQSAGFDEQYENEGSIQIQRQEGEIVPGTPHPEVLEPLSSADGQNSLLFDFQNSQGAPSEGPGPLYFSETQDSQSYASTRLYERTTPGFDSPQTLLGAGRLDPFQTSSIHINRSVAELVDHCVLPFFRSYKTPNHLQFHAPVPLIRHRPHYHACHVLWRTMSQANSY